MSFKEKNKEKVESMCKDFFMSLRKEFNMNFTVGEMREFEDSLVEKVSRTKNFKVNKNPFRFVELSPAISLGEVSDILSGIQKTINGFDMGISFEFLLKLVEEIHEDNFFDEKKAKADSMRRVKVPRGFEIDFRENEKTFTEMDSVRNSFNGEIEEVRVKKAPRSFVNSSFSRGCFNKVKDERKEWYEKELGREGKGCKVKSKSKKSSVSISKEEIEKTNSLLGNLLG